MRPDLEGGTRGNERGNFGTILAVLGHTLEELVVLGFSPSTGVVVRLVLLLF